MVLDFRKQRFESPADPSRDWLDWFRDEFSRALYKIDIESDPDEPFRFVAMTRMLPDLAISRTLHPRMRGTHRPDTNDDISLTVPLAGVIVGDAAGTPYEIKPGMALFGRNADAARGECPSGTQVLSIRLKRSLFEPLIDVATLGNFAVRPNTQAMRLLLSYIEMLDAEDQIDTPEARDLITTQVHDLAAMVFGAQGDAHALVEQRGRRAGRLAAVKRDISEHLASPNLSVSAVAGRQGVSPRYIHMLFEAEGSTFTEYVLGRRLARAHRMLCDVRSAHVPIYDIALQVGFGDLSYFNRTFRRHFGMTPSEVRFGKTD